jgi:hypothetical protein
MKRFLWLIILLFSYTVVSYGQASPPPVPTLISPAHGATGVSVTPTLVWSSSKGAVTYTVQMSTALTFSPLTLNTSGITDTSYKVTGLGYGTQYYWRVLAFNSDGVSSVSGSKSFQTLIGPPPVPQLVSPATDSIEAPLNLTLNWNASFGATSYSLQVSTNPGFTTTLVNQTNLTATSYSLTGLSIGTIYYWRVNATSPNGTSVYSTANKFTTVLMIPAVPVLLSPADSALNVSLSPTFTWTPSSTAASYNLQVSTKLDFSTIAISKTGLTTAACSLTGLSTSTLYYWRVNAVNTYGASAYSSVRKIVTVPPAPAAPVLSSPADGAVDAAINPVLVWNASTGADSYTLQVSLTATFASYVFNQSGITNLSDTLIGLQGLTTYYWRVSATNVGGVSAFSTARSFKTKVGPPAIPIVVSPSDGSLLIPTTVPLVWRKSTAAISYFVQVSTQPDFSSVFINQINITDTTFLISNLANGVQYYWRVGAYNANGVSNYSAATKFTTASITIPAPTLIYPANGATDVPISASFSWNSCTYAESYSIQASLSSDFSNPVFSQSGLTVTYVPLTGLQNNTTYYWRVIAAGQGLVSLYSVVDSFKTIIAVPDAPALLTPADNTTGVLPSSNLVWRSSARAASYIVQIALSPDFTAFVVNKSNVTDTVYSIASLDANIKYYWRIAAYNSGGIGSFSAIRSFKTLINLPGTPTLELPINKALDVSANPVLSWDAASSAESYTLQVSLKSDFSSFVINQTGITTTSYTATGLLNSTVYYWRAAAVNSRATSAYSSVFSFSTIISAPDAPILVSPLDNSKEVFIGSTLVWRKSARADSYNLQVSKSQDFSTFVINQSKITDTALVMTNIVNNTKYYWRVSAINVSGTSSYNEIRSFTTRTLFNIKGIVCYDNKSASPLKNVKMQLTSIVSKIPYNAVTDSTGAYAFALFPVGKYILSASKTDGWGGVNSSDALLAGKYFNGLDSLDEIQMNAADVDNSGLINYADALMILNRYLGIVNSFSNNKTDWVFKNYQSASIKNVPYSLAVTYPDTVTITDTDLAFSFKALCTGDINKSYNLSGLSKSAASGMLAKGVSGISTDGIIEIPVSLDRDVELGSASLKFNYPEESLKFVGIKYNGAIKGAAIKAEKGSIVIGWANIGGRDGVKIENGSALVTLEFQLAAKANIDKCAKLTLDNESEITDMNGKDLTANFIAPEIKAEIPEVYHISQNYPNPFNPSTIIKYSMPVKSEVRIRVFNILGSQVKELVNGVIESGYHEAVFNGSDLASGVYLYSIEARSLESGKMFRQVKKMVLMK